MWKVAPQSIVKSSKSWRVFIILTWLLHLIIFNIHLGPSWFWHMSQALHWQLQWNPRAAKHTKWPPSLQKGGQKACFGCYLMLSAILHSRRIVHSDTWWFRKDEAIGSLTVGIVEKAMTGNDQWSLKPCFFLCQFRKGEALTPSPVSPGPL